MTNEKNETDQELDEFLSGESKLNKIYAQRDSLQTSAHLESSVKQMVRDKFSSEKKSSENKFEENLNLNDCSKCQITKGNSIPMTYEPSGRLSPILRHISHFVISDD